MSPLVQGLLVGFFAGVVVCSTIVCAFIMYVHKTAEDEVKADDLDGPETPNDI